MNNETVTLGICLFGFGVLSIIARIRTPEKFAKLGPLLQKFGEKNGKIIHLLFYTILPILIGIALLAAGFRGISVF